MPNGRSANARSASTAKHGFELESPRVEYQNGIWTMHADGAEPDLVVRYGHEPSWHPGFNAAAAQPLPPPTIPGQFIAYVAATNTSYELFVVRPDGTDKRQLTTGGGAQPAWSPNHRRLAYLHSGLRDSSIRIINMRTGKEQVVGGYSSGLDWSPDGKQLMWSDYYDLVVSNLRSGARHRIPVPEYGVTNPVWSPDGEWIAFSQGGAIKLVRSTGGTPRTVTCLDGAEVQPA